MSASEIPDLVGKVIGAKYGNGNNAWMEVASLELKAGRHFLVGKTISTQDNEEAGTRVCVAWDAVTAYYEFDSLEECNEAIASWYPVKKKSRFSLRGVLIATLLIATLLVGYVLGAIAWSIR